MENNIDTSLIHVANSTITEIFKQPTFRKKLAEEQNNRDNYEYNNEAEKKDEIKPILTKFMESVEDIYLPNNYLGQLIKIDKDQHSMLIYRTPNYPKIKLPLTSSLSQNKKSIKTNAYSIGDYKTVRIMSYYIDYQKIRYLVQIAAPLEKIQKPLFKMRTILLFFTPILILLLSFIAYFFIKRAFSPVKSVVFEVKKITAKDLSKHIKSINSNDEIGELIETFNHLFNRLENSFRHIKQFSLDVSHELKTPLTVLQGEIEVTLRQKRKEEEYVKTLKSLYEEVIKLQNIIKNLFLLSNLESGKFNLTLTKIDIYDVLTEVFDELYKLAEQKKQNIKMKITDSAIIMGNKELLIRLFFNILENAIKYTPNGGKIIIELQKKETSVLVSISDNGAGIEPKFREKIFDRFFRIDESRNSETGGTGLGLAIAQKIAQLHNTRIQVQSGVNKGSTFFIIFPT